MKSPNKIVDLSLPMVLSLVAFKYFESLSFVTMFCDNNIHQLLFILLVHGVSFFAFVVFVLSFISVNINMAILAFLLFTFVMSFLYSSFYASYD